MNKHSKLKKYVELFNRKIVSYLSNNVSIKTTIHPVIESGAVFELHLNTDDDETITISKAKQSVGHVLENIPQNMFEGNLSNVTFKGTNLYLEGSRILVIKGGDSHEEWTGESVLNDVERVLSTSQGAK